MPVAPIRLHWQSVQRLVARRFAPRDYSTPFGHGSLFGPCENSLPVNISFLVGTAGLEPATLAASALSLIYVATQLVRCPLWPTELRSVSAPAFGALSQFIVGPGEGDVGVATATKP